MNFISPPQLTNIYIPASVTTINNGAFESSNIKIITFAPGSSLKAIGSRTFFNCKQLLSIAIPASVVTIGASAFENSNLANITFTETSKLATIATFAFMGAKLNSVTIPKSVTDIGTDTFKNLPLSSVTFAPDSTLKTIGQGAFYNCTQIKSVTIPRSTQRIYRYAFRQIGNLSFKLESRSTKIIVNYYAFEDSRRPTDPNITQWIEWDMTT